MSEPAVFGNFELTVDGDELRPLGVGSFGKTYRGKHRFLGTQVAIKVIRQRFSENEKYKETFLQEARLVARLSDPHIVRILDFGEQEGRLYYVMDFCDGGTLKDLAKKSEELTDSLVIELARQGARALVCAHRQDIIHRDIKPENIMLDSSEDGGVLFVKLIDFGLAQNVANLAGFSEARAEGFHGTPMFASPEQLMEKPVDGRSDLFSLGMTLWWLALGGQLPFSGDKETVNERLSPTSYQALLQETLSPELALLLIGLLEKDPQARHQSAAEFLGLLDESFPYQPILSSHRAPAPAAPEPVTAERCEGPLEGSYRIVRKITENGPGAYYEAARLADGENFWLWVAHGTDSRDWRPDFEQRMALLQSVQPTGVSIPLSYEEFDEGVLCYTLQKHSGSFLVEGHEGRHQFSLAELGESLERATRAADELASLGLPLPEFTPESIEWAVGNAEFAPLFPTLAESGETSGAEAMGTISPDAIGDLSPAARFVMLAYPLLAGRRFPIAALYSPAAYVTVPGISETSNRHLKEWAGSDSRSASLSSLLATLLVSEGLKEHSLIGFGSRLPAASTSRSPFPSQRSETHLHPFPSFGASGSTRRVPLGSVAGNPTLTPSVVPRIPAPPAEIPQAPVAQPAAATPVRKKPRAGLFATLAVFSLLLLAAAGGAFWFLKLRKPEVPVEKPPVAKTPDKPNLPPVSPGDPEKLALQSELKPLFFKRERVPELKAGRDRYVSLYGSGDPFVAEIDTRLASLAKAAETPIQVPADQPTLAAAMAEAQPGQTILLAAGTHSAQLTCKPGVRLLGESSRSTILEMPSDSASALTIREGATVTLENLTVRAARKTPDSPALVTVIGGSLLASNCVFKDGGSEGLYVSSAGKLDLEDCEITQCDGNGLQLLGKSIAQLLKCEIHHNGKSGIWAAPAEVSLVATDCKVTENSFSGLETEGGAEINLIGGEFSQNQVSGVNLSGEGTRLEAAKTSFSKNGKVGVLGQAGALVKLTGCQVEDNKETGIDLRKTKPGSALSKVTFSGNGVFGFYVEGTGELPANPTADLAGCFFKNHATAALAATDHASLVVRDHCQFLNNQVAVFSAAGATIDLRQSMIRYRPVSQEGLVREGGEITETELTVDEL